MDNIAMLCKEIIGINSIGQEVKRLEQRQVFCKSRSLTRSEFYSASQAGLNPDIVITLSNRADYENEKIVIFEGEEYTVTRTYWTSDADEIELTLTRRVHNG